MTNPFYVASGTPATSSFGASQPMRSEFQAIQGGFEKFPDFTGSAPGTFLINNFTATGITTAPTMLIDASGNIGIGTPPNPTTYLIDIRRDRASGSNLRLMNASLDPASGVGITLNNGSARNFHLLYLSQFAVNSGINRLDGAQIIATGDGGLTLATGVSTPAAGLYFATNSIERARFDNNGVFTVHTITQFDTNVSVTGSLSSNGPLTVGAVGMPGSVFFKRDSDGAIQTRISENSGNTGLYFETISGGWFSFFTSGAAFGSNLERMRIDSSGNVSIGVPGSIPLSVNRNQNAETMVQVTNPNGGAGAYTSVRVTGPGPGYGSFAYIGPGVAQGNVEIPDGVIIGSTGTGGMTLSAYYTNYIRFCTNFVERMRIDSNGNVGIGVAPSYRLDVLGSVVARDNRNLGNTFGSILYGGDASLAPFVGSNYAGPFAIGTNNTERMRIISTGEVGIGRIPQATILLDVGIDQNNYSVARVKNDNTGSAARAMLQVSNGAGTSSFSMLSTGWSSSGLDQAGYATLNTSSGMSIYTAAAFPLLFGTNNTERMRIDQFGNVFALTGGMRCAYGFSSFNNQTPVASNTLVNSGIGFSTGAWLVHAYIYGVGTAQYSAVAIVVCDGLDARAALINQGGLLSISVSGLGLYGQQNSGVSQTINWIVTKFYA